MSTKNPILINRVVAYSNIVGCMIVLFWEGDRLFSHFKLGHWLAVLSCTLSYVYHLIEIRNGQPLVEGFSIQDVHNHLWVDRIGAFISFLYCASLLLRPLSNMTIGLGLFGLACLGISESRIIRDRLFFGRHIGTLWVFCLFHCLWHICAFTLLTMATARDPYSILLK